MDLEELAQRRSINAGRWVGTVAGPAENGANGVLGPFDVVRLDL